MSDLFGDEDEFYDDDPLDRLESEDDVFNLDYDDYDQFRRDLEDIIWNEDEF